VKFYTLKINPVVLVTTARWNHLFSSFALCFAKSYGRTSYGKFRCYNSNPSEAPNAVRSGGGPFRTEKWNAVSTMILDSWWSGKVVIARTTGLMQNPRLLPGVLFLLKI